MDPNCFDVFRLLIESGAGTENCNLYVIDFTPLYDYLLMLLILTVLLVMAIQSVFYGLFGIT